MKSIQTEIQRITEEIEKNKELIKSFRKELRELKKFEVKAQQLGLLNGEKNEDKKGS